MCGMGVVFVWFICASSVDVKRFAGLTDENFFIYLFDALSSAQSTSVHYCLKLLIITMP